MQILASGSWSARVRLGFCQPARLAHLCKAGCMPPLSVFSQPGVQVAQQNGLMIWLPLVFVRFAHDEILNEGEWMMLCHIR